MDEQREVDFSRMMHTAEHEGKLGPMGSSRTRHKTEQSDAEDVAASATNELTTESRDDRGQLLSTRGARGLSWRPTPPGRVSKELVNLSWLGPFWARTAYLVLNQSR